MHRGSGTQLALIAAAVIAALSGCTPAAGSSGNGNGAPSSASSSPAAPIAFDQELQGELVAMAERDQDERTGWPSG